VIRRWFPFRWFLLTATVAAIAVPAASASPGAEGLAWARAYNRVATAHHGPQRVLEIACGTWRMFLDCEVVIEVKATGKTACATILLLHQTRIRADRRIVRADGIECTAELTA